MLYQEQEQGQEFNVCEYCNGRDLEESSDAALVGEPHQAEEKKGRKRGKLFRMFKCFKKAVGSFALKRGKEGDGKVEIVTKPIDSSESNEQLVEQEVGHDRGVDDSARGGSRFVMDSEFYGPIRRYSLDSSDSSSSSDESRENCFCRCDGNHTVVYSSDSTDSERAVESDSDEYEYYTPPREESEWKVYRGESVEDVPS